MASIGINRFMLAAGGILLALSLWGAWGLWQDAGAHSIGWKWNTTSAPRVVNSGTPYGSEIESASDDYNDNTDLDVRWCVSPCNENIVHASKNLGAGIIAGADSFSNGKQCNTSQIDCNETTNRVTSGFVAWNTTYKPKPNTSPGYVALHEMGHIFGLAHAPCATTGPGIESGVTSVMGVSCPYAGPSTLQPHDKADINDKY